MLFFVERFFDIVVFSSSDASDISWTYPLQGIAFNWIRQLNEVENQVKVIECVCGERIEQQLEFELNRQLFRFNNEHINSKYSESNFSFLYV